MPALCAALEKLPGLEKLELIPAKGATPLTTEELRRISAAAPGARIDCVFSLYGKLAGPDTEDLRYHHVLGRSIGGIIDDFAPNDVLYYDQGIGSYVLIGPSEQQYGLLIETTGDRAQARKDLAALYTELSLEKNGIEDKPYMFGFITDILSERLAQVKRQLSLVRLFMLLSLLLSILGLIAMSRFYADEHSKDIAIRKVFGSTMETEIRKTVLEYLLLLGVAAVIAVPIAIWLTSKLLEQYSYRITGYGWVFMAAVLLAMVVAFLSILWQTLKAAKTNPALELKKE